MAEPVTGQCKFVSDKDVRCQQKAHVGNPGWITSITGLSREEIQYCDDHFDQVYAEADVIDLGVGVAHTRSAEFQNRESGLKDMLDGADGGE